jgi:hypothetical protein
MKQAEDPPANRCGATGCGCSHWAYRGNLWDISGRDETFSLTLMRIPDGAPFGERRIGLDLRRGARRIKNDWGLGK